MLMNMVLAQFGVSEVIQVYVLLMAIRRKPINPSNSKCHISVFGFRGNGSREIQIHDVFESLP